MEFSLDLNLRIFKFVEKMTDEPLNHATNDCLVFVVVDDGNGLPGLAIVFPPTVLMHSWCSAAAPGSYLTAGTRRKGHQLVLWLDE